MPTTSKTTCLGIVCFLLCVFGLWVDCVLRLWKSLEDDKKTEIKMEGKVRDAVQGHPQLTPGCYQGI